MINPNSNYILEVMEDDLCNRFHCLKTTLRTHLANYQFSKVQKFVITYKLNKTDKRPHKTYKYKISIKDLLLLKSMFKGNKTK